MVDFLVIGPRASIICGNIFPLVKERRIMLGSYRKDDIFSDMKVQLLCGSGGELSAIKGEKKFSRILIKKKIS